METRKLIRVHRVAVVLGLCVGPATLGLSGCDAATESASGIGMTRSWSVWTPEGTTLSVPADTGLLAGRDGGLTSRPTKTRDGHPINVDADGALTYVPPLDFWGATSFEYEIEGERHTGFIGVAPSRRWVSWESSANRQLLTGWREGDGFGSQLVNAGDMDADGDDELVVAAPLASASFGPNQIQGAIVVVPGRRDRTFSHGGNWLYGDRGGMRLGTRLCAPGDQDGDGLADIWALSGDQEPRLHLLTGRDDLREFAGAELSAVVHRTIRGLPIEDADHIICGSDWTGDGVSDVLLADDHELWVVDGAATNAHALAKNLTGAWQDVALGDARFGQLSSVSDLDGDGATDVLAIVNDLEKVTLRYRVDVYRSSDGAVETLMDGFDSARAVVTGDFDGDGINDLVVSNDDIVRVYFGGADGGADPTTPDATLSSLLGSDGAVMRAADLNGDGVDDLLLSYPDADGPPNHPTPRGLGLVAVLLGGEFFSDPYLSEVKIVRGTDGFILHGSTPDAGFGQTGIVLGDFDGDGVPDLAVSAPGQTIEVPSSGEPAERTGAALIIRGFGPPRD